MRSALASPTFSPLGRPFGLRSSLLNRYAVQGVTPEVVAAFDRDRYWLNGRGVPFADLLTFSRASTATYVDASGILQTAASGEPRTGHHVYEGGQWVKKGLRFESEARTNLVLDSEDFTTANWNSYSGEVTVDLSSETLFGKAVHTLTGTTGGFGNGRLGPDASIVLPASGVAHFWARKLSAGDALQYFWNGAVSSYDAQVPNDGEWHYVEIPLAAATSVLQILRGYTSGVVQVSIPQLEAGPTPSSYIPTAGSTVTRAAETLTIPAAKLPYSSVAMWMQMDGLMSFVDDGDFVAIRHYYWYADANNYITNRVNVGGTRTGEMNFQQAAAGVAESVNSAPDYYTPGVDVPFNIAARHGATFINGALDGTALTADLTPTSLPDLSATDLQLGFDFMGTIGKYRLGSGDIGDSGMAGASA